MNPFKIPYTAPLMPSFTINFDDRETLPKKLTDAAAQLSITPEQLIKRYISECIHKDIVPVPGNTAETLEELFVANGVLKKQ